MRERQAVNGNKVIDQPCDRPTARLHSPDLTAKSMHYSSKHLILSEKKHLRDPIGLDNCRQITKNYAKIPDFYDGIVAITVLVRSRGAKHLTRKP